MKSVDQVNLYDPKSPTFCPGCGDYGIWAGLKTAISKLGWGTHNYVIVYGVGCSGNMTDFIKSHGFHSLHGRALPNAEGIKLANHNLKVVCVVGDGDCYGEGGNHLIHAMRGNADIKVIVHDNRVYGLTTGQSAPTSPKGYKSKSTPQGVIEYPVNPLTLAVTQGASFVAQGFAADVPYLIELMKEAFSHKGFSLLNVLQPCVTFNKVNTYDYYRQRVYKVELENHHPTDILKALEITLGNNDRIPLGVIYKVSRLTYQDQEEVLKKGPLVKQPLRYKVDYQKLLEEYLEGQSGTFPPAGNP